MTIIESIFRNRNRTNNKEVNKYINNLKPFNFKVINIVGTNGKGSISSYLTTNLIKKYKVGTFTSPHIFEANERIKINNIPIPKNIFEKLIKKYKGMHFFAIVYLCALDYFKENECDIVILEAGIGGKYDTTNTLDSEIGILTSVDLDHINILGNTKKEILANKIEIMNKDMNFYTGSELNNLNYIIKKRSKEIGANHIIVKNNFKNYKTRNQKLAEEVLKKEFKINDISFKEPLGRTTIQKNNGHIAIIDVAHNKSGIMASLNFLKQNKIHFQQVVITISKTKDLKGIKKLFFNKDIFVYQLNKNFISYIDLKAKEVFNLEEFYSKQNKDTLYIGSFYSAGRILNVKEKS